MPLDVPTATQHLTSFFDAIASQVSGSVANAALPLIGKLTDLPDGGAAADPFGSLKTQILNAVAGATGADVAQAIADAITSRGIPGVSAAKTASGGVDITIAAEQQVDTGNELLDIGASVGNFLDLKVTTGATFNAALNATISFAADGSVSLASQATPELAVTVAANLGINNLNADLGVANVTLNDADPTNPEFQANFGFDFAYSGAAFTATPTLAGSAGLVLTFETTNVLAGLLPDMRGNLIVDFATGGATFSAPTVKVADVKVDLGSYVGIVGGVFGDLGKLFNSEPLGTLVDIATEPVPVLDDIAHAVPGLLGVFDKVGGLTGGGDGVITIGDLAAFQSKEAEDILDPWYQALDIISKIQKIGTLAGADEINIGGGTLVGGVTTPDNDPAAIVAALKAELARLGLPQEVQDFFSDIEIGGLPAAAAAPSKGFTFGLFENPGDILKILLTNEAVDLVKFDVPPLALDQAAGGFFPVLGPLGFLLEGRVRAGLDVDIGYDTQGLIDNNLANGFFVTTEAATTPITPNWENPEGLPFLPVGALDTTLSAGAGVGFLGSSITVNGRFGFGLHAYFEAADANGKFRPGADGFDCVFEPVGGRAGVSVNVTIKIGFGPFSIKKNITLAEATLADFEVFKCPPPSVVATPEAPGLATAVGTDLSLNVGEPSRADQRLIVDEHDNTAKPIAAFNDPATPANESLNESYVIGLARDQGANEINPLDNPPPTLVPGKLDVFAFGFTQRVDVPAVIKADFKSGNDMLVIQRDVVVGSEVSGGAGFDTLIGGGGRDILRGDGDDDVLSGNDGIDDLFGGTGDDQLSGGKGGDLLNGEGGIDTVDYSKANRDTRQGVFVTITLAGDVIGRGGEAEGDRLISIESLIGTDFADDFRAGFGVTQNLVFDGGAGGDILIGGKGEDLLLGGIGADHLNGDDAVRADGLTAYDGTSYITSWGAVDIDLQRTIQRGGDAQGDRLFSIEAVEGSINSDTLLGNASANILVGNDGHDVLEGRGGTDFVGGDFGNDLVYGSADGDTLDGGPNVDTLSYEHVAGPVTVDLGATQERILGLTVFVPGSAPDNIVMARPAEGSVRGISTFENLIGTAGADTLVGDIANNQIVGRHGADLISGDAGFDILVGGFGAVDGVTGDILLGGTGIDWVYYSDSPSSVTVDLAGGFGSGGTAQGDFIATIENILGSASADSLFGNEVDNIIDPNISGAAVTEFVDGRSEFDGDTLRLNYSGIHADIGQGVVGGYGDDTPSDGSFQRLTSSGSATLDTVNFVDIERLDVVGTRSADTIYAGFGDDRIVTGSGNDTILAGKGGDVVYAGSGDDFVAYGNIVERQLQLDVNAPTKPFLLAGGAGIDTLSISLSGATEAIALIGGTDTTEAGVNLRLANGGAVTGFERLEQVRTGRGDDTVTQLGRVDNDFRTGAGVDVLSPGLGHDSVDGGFDYRFGVEVFQGESDGLPPITVLDLSAVKRNPGDLLVLDYSSVIGPTGVSGSVSLVLSPVQINDILLQNLLTNEGTYNFSFDGAPDSLSYTGIERLEIKGTNQGDLLVGTHDTFAFIGLEGVNSSTTLRGDDRLEGLGGEDTIIGYTGDDTILGGDGNDVLIGTDPSIFSNPLGEDPSESERAFQIDCLTGGSGADVFVLGVEDGYFYSSFGASEDDPVLSNRAIITDFTPTEDDRIQLYGAASDYRVEVLNDATLLFRSTEFFGDQLIGEVQNFTNFDLNANYVAYVNENTPLALAAASVGLSSDLPAVTASAAGDPLASMAAGLTLGAAAEATTAASALNATSWVAQNGNTDALKVFLDGATGGTGSTLTLSGSADAFGTFENDPFGLGKGIILSTGRVEDLPGQNIAESGGSNVMSIPITFVNIGRAGGSDIFRADLSNLGINIRSLTIADGNTLLGGAGGIASGFDLDAVALSRIRLDSVSATTNLNDQSVLTERLDVFDFSAASLTFTPGTQRPPTGAFENGPTLDGAANVTLVDNFQSTLGLFSFGADSGSLTLGDGGSLALQLTQSVSTSAPLYLYIGEEGLTGETVIGRIEVSPDTIEPTGDLSTDLGASGPDGDTTSLTYTFTPNAGDTAFSLDVVLFSEELPEFDGTNLTDLFSIKLNGREIGALSNGAALTVRNLVYAGSGDLVYNPVGTGPLADTIKADAFTKTLTITGAIDPGVVNTLTIEVKDGRDAFLDSGLLIKDGSFKTFTLPEFSAVNEGDGTLVIGGDGVKVTVSLPNGSTLTVPVDVVVTPTPTIDLGAGPGQPITLTFNPGDTSQVITVQAAPGANPDDDAAITYEIISDDPALGGQELAPEVFDLVVPPNKAPEITPPAGEIRVAENTKAVTTVIATDPDAGQTLKYEIVDGADKDLFDINESTGELSFRAAPDFEKPGDAGKDNVYDVVVRASDNGTPVLRDEQAIVVRVTDVAETSTLQVKFVSEKASFKNTFGWYNTQTLVGAIVFGAIEAEGRNATVKPGVTTATFDVNTADVANIAFFVVPNGGGLSQNTASELGRPIKLVQLANGSWAAATVGADGNVQLDASGKPNILVGSGTNAFFTETSKNAGGVDYASSKVGTQQTSATLAGDTADGPTGLLAWEDTAAIRKSNGTFTKPGDADYNDAVVEVKEFKGQTINGTDAPETLTGGLADDVIYGMAGNDRLNGGEGDDRLDGGPGADRMTGGPGNDIYVVDDTGDVVVESSNAGSDTVLTTLATLTLVGHVENLIYTGTTAFSGTGNNLANNLTGGTGGDTLSGLGGADRIAGLGGDDRLTGGDAADTFVIGPDSGQDVITDFRMTGSTHDFIELAHSIFPQYATVQQLLASNQVTQVGVHVLITADPNDTLTLQNVSLITLRAHPEDFFFT